MKNKLSNKARQVLKKLNAMQKLGVAESCTGGQISALLTSIPGASKVFQGAVVSYSNDVKIDVLGVKEKTLKKYGAVSSQVALEMARGALKVLKSDWAIAVTGVAGPDGGTKLKPVGLVYCAVVGPKVALVERNIFSGHRKSIQQKSTERSIELLLKKIK